jgi:HAD superfamily hydrolase (TIGR01509 family)
MPIRAAVFDVGGVLERVDDANWPQPWIARWERRMGLPSGHVEGVLAAQASPAPMTELQMRATYAGALGLDERQADELMAEMWDAYCGEPDTVLRDFVAGLRPGLTTAILSNSADGARREEQRRYGFEDLVDVLVYSHEVGLEKPDPAIFRLTEQLLGVRPEEVVFLDDIAGHVEAAARCGWHAVLHRDTESSLRAIRRLLRSPAGRRDPASGPPHRKGPK